MVVTWGHLNEGMKWKPKKLAFCVREHFCSPGAGNGLFEGSKQLPLKAFSPHFLSRLFLLALFAREKRNKGLDLQRFYRNTKYLRYEGLILLSTISSVLPVKLETSNGRLSSALQGLLTKPGVRGDPGLAHWWTQSRYTINACWFKDDFSEVLIVSTERLKVNSWPLGFASQVGRMEQIGGMLDLSQTGL